MKIPYQFRFTICMNGQHLSSCQDRRTAKSRLGRILPGKDPEVDSIYILDRDTGEIIDASEYYPEFK